METRATGDGMQHETDASIQEQIDELHGLTTTQLVERFAELH